MPGVPTYRKIVAQNLFYLIPKALLLHTHTYPRDPSEVRQVIFRLTY